MNENPLKTLGSYAKIRFADCDPFNHLNNSRYLDYFINAREDQIEEKYDLNVYLIGKTTGKSWVVGSNQIAYLKPVFLMERVYIESQLIQYSDKNTMVEMKMYSEDQSKLKSVLWSNFIYFNFETQKSDVHEKHFMDLFKDVVSPVAENNFNERIYTLQNNH